jgi:hypothetical protein
MTSDLNGQIEPLCTFGPGGDFVAHWPPEGTKYCEWSTPFVRLLAVTVEIVAVIFGLRRSIAFIDPANLPGANELRGYDEERIAHADEISQAHDTTDPSPASASADGSALSGEPMLFPNLRRDGVRIEHQPKHRLRAHHRAAKKGSALRFSKQGTLFNIDFTRAQIA